MSNDKFITQLVDVVATANALSDAVRVAIQNEADIPNEVILALSNYRAKEKEFENLLDLLLSNSVILN